MKITKLLIATVSTLGLAYAQATPPVVIADDPATDPSEE